MANAHKNCKQFPPPAAESTGNWSSSVRVSVRRLARLDMYNSCLAMSLMNMENAELQLNEKDIGDGRIQNMAVIH